jgi:hypothetical protein
MTLETLLTGGIAAGSAFAGLFFLRFWSRTRDRFFLYFSLSFFIESANRIVLGLFPAATESNPLTYGVRILAYGLILLAILHKNRPGPRR